MKMTDASPRRGLYGVFAACLLGGTAAAAVPAGHDARRPGDASRWRGIAGHRERGAEHVGTSWHRSAARSGRGISSGARSRVTDVGGSDTDDELPLALVTCVELLRIGLRDGKKVSVKSA
jgi:hypothetical protein